MFKSKNKKTEEKPLSEQKKEIETPKSPELSEQSALKLTRYISEMERIAKENQELAKHLTFTIKEGKPHGEKRCTIAFHSDTSIPYVVFEESGIMRFDSIRIELSEIRDLLFWLKQRGIE